MKRIPTIVTAVLVTLALAGCNDDNRTDPREGRVTIERSDCFTGSCAYSWKVCIGPDLYTHTDLGARNGKAVADDRRDANSPECAR